MAVFEVQIKKTQRADHLNSVDFPKKKGAFVLVFNDNWNDYGLYTSFALWYFPNGEKRLIGELKIISTKDTVTYKLIKDGFTKLGDNFCSLGQSVSYYRNLKNLLSEKECADVLTSLRDCAFDKRIYEEFKADDNMNTSLFRESYAIRTFYEAPSILKGRDPEEAYTFKYTRNNPFDRRLSMDWNVQFDYDSAYFKRCIGIIGENGVGKTRMLSSFTKDFFNSNSLSFSHKPLFSGIIVINSTKHDRYPSERDIFEMRGGNNDRLNHHFYRQLSLDAFEDVNNIVDAIVGLSEKPTLRNESIIAWFRRSLISSISPSLDNLFELKQTIKEEQTWDGQTIQKEVNSWEPKSKEELNELIRILSSGELHSLALMTFLYANIHLSSLVILDEPEIHLHPSVLINLMNCVYDVLEIYNSYAIIATHSPLIIREIVKKNVYRLKRMDGEVPTLNRVAFDTFGEDIASLYLNIFGYDESNSLFTKVVRKLAYSRRKTSTEDIVRIVSDEDRVNLNARMRITQIIDEVKDAQSD